MRFEFIEYEVRGNDIDQYEGTTAHPTGVFVDVPRNALDEDIARTLKARGLIDRTVKSSAVLVEGDPEVALEGFYVLNPYSSQPTYRPAFRLERRQAGLKRRSTLGGFFGLGEGDDAPGKWVVVYPRQVSEDLLAAIWDMYLISYSKIGYIMDNPRDLAREYSVWKIYVAEGVPRAFRLAKLTAFGTKMGLSGSDGSEVGKNAIRNDVAAWFLVDGNYGEVSHAMERLAQRYNAPVVCAEHAAQVLNKPIEVSADGVHYRRKLAGVGDVQKMMVGRPFDVPTTSFSAPACLAPLSSAFGRAGRASNSVDYDLDSILTHFSDMIV